MKKQFEYEFVVTGRLSKRNIEWLNMMIKSHVQELHGECSGMFGQETVREDEDFEDEYTIIRKGDQ